jgi:outer membrane protein
MNASILILLLHANVLTVDVAVETAESHHPNLTAAEAREIGADAKARAAGAALSPTLSASARLGTNASSPFGVAVNSRSTYDMGLSASYLLWDGGRTKDRVAAAEVRGDAQRIETRIVRADTITNVKLSFVDAQLSKQLADVARDTLAREEKRLAEVTGLVEAGSRPKIDLLRQQTAVASARAAMVRAVSDYERARTELNRAMGVSRDADYEVDDTPIAMLHGEDLNTASLMSTALTSRAELASVDAQIAAQKLTLQSTSKGLTPTVRISASSGWGGADFDRPSWSAGAGISLSWNIFDGGATRANTKAAEVEAVVLRSRRRALEQQIHAEVATARLGVRTAKESLHAADVSLASARELLDVAEQRYSAGVGNIIEVSDAQVAVTRAAGERARALTGLSNARVRLARAMGVVQ